MTAYYNEIDTDAADWLRNLIAAGHIAPGVVDTRSIEDVHPRDLDGFTQVHFFAGIGVWSHALRLAGWDDARPVWTGSCPCQPFSSAGKGDGFADERHLWPAFFHLIEQHRPADVFGEQVASADGLDWLDVVSADLEGAHYAFGAADLCAAGVGAPHIRQRLYWTAQAVGLGHAHGRRRQGARLHAQRRHARGEPVLAGAGQAGEHDGTGAGGGAARARPTADAPGGATHGFWADADWLSCRDGRWRPVEPGAFPLAARTADSMGRLHAYGNAIVAQVAATFIRAAAGR